MPVHVYLNLTRPELMTAAGSLLGAALGALIHRLGQRYHVTISRAEVAAVAKLVESLTPPEVDAVVEVVAKAAEAIIPAAPVAETTVRAPEPAPALVVNPIGFAPGNRP